jgi:Protein DA1/LIM domain
VKQRKKQDPVGNTILWFVALSFVLCCCIHVALLPLGTLGDHNNLIGESWQEQAKNFKDTGDRRPSKFPSNSGPSLLLITRYLSGTMYGASTELSEDELLARRLQEEEERSVASHTPMNDLSQLSIQEREDMMLARQMQEIDSYGPGPGVVRVSSSPYGHNNSNEDRLAYARRLQERAFERVRSSTPPPPQPEKSREESDLELAMKMQIEEGGAMDPPTMDQEDEDMKLARFMEESGVSIRELDEEGLEAAKHGIKSGLAGSLGGLGAPSALGLGPGAGGGGMLGGMYGNRRDDSSEEEDSMEMGFAPTKIPPAGRPKPAPSGIPSSIPAAPSSIPPPPPRAAARPTPSSIPGAVSIPAATPPASIPSAIPPPSGNRKPPPISSPNVAAIELPGGRQASIRLGGNRGADFQRQVPMASKSSGAGTGGRSGPSRMLPSASKSFGVARSNGRGLPDQEAQSAHNLMAMRSAAARSDRSKSPQRRLRGRRGQREQETPIVSIVGDLPPGVNMASANDPLTFGQGSPEAASSSVPAKKKKGKLLSRIFRGGKHEKAVNPSDIPDGIPAAIPGPHEGPAASGPLPHSITASRKINKNSLRSSISSQPQPVQQERRQAVACSVCGGRSGKMLVAMDKRFHVECFRCMSCNEVIDPSSVFAVSVDPMGEQQPLHRKCYAEFYGVQCAVCKKAIPANEDGSVSFIKHPFFSTEQMCPNHAEEPGRRRCTGCHRFEPEDEPFADLHDGDRCVCYSCCRTVIMNNMDVEPLWSEVLRFLEFGLGLPIWEEMRDIPILIVDQAALNESQLKDGTSVHGDSSQIMTRGLCLSEHDGSMSFRVPSQKFNDSIASFEACNHSGFMDFDVGPLKGNANSEVMAILCLSGLPRDLTASVLAHEATHAWIKLHPDFKVRNALPAQVEEGCAQLVAYLFLCDGLEEPRRSSTNIGPSDEKLRQYFKFSIETDDNDIYGEGYRRAALAYSTIGIAALLNHVVHYQEFPEC